MAAQENTKSNQEQYGEEEADELQESESPGSEHSEG